MPVDGCVFFLLIFCLLLLLLLLLGYIFDIFSTLLGTIKNVEAVLDVVLQLLYARLDRLLLLQQQLVLVHEGTEEGEEAVVGSQKVELIVSGFAIAQLLQPVFTDTRSVQS